MLAWVWASHFKVLCQSLFMLWVRHCQGSYPIRGQVLLRVNRSDHNTIVDIKGIIVEWGLMVVLMAEVMILTYLYFE